MVQMHRALLAVLAVGCAVAPASSPSSERRAVELVSAEAAGSSMEISVSSVSGELAWPAPQTVFEGYGGEVRAALWAVYAGGGTELYCRAPFSASDARARRVGDLALSWEHAYPADRAAGALGFDDRDCRDPLPGRPGPPELCRAAVGDLHNLWPAFSRINSSRSDHPYAELSGEGTTNQSFQPFCPDYERAQVDGVVYVEPTADARGDVARSLIYMHEVYGLPLEAVIDDPRRLLEWAVQDPVDEEEAARERAIREAQGSWNPLVLPAPAG